MTGMSYLQASRVMRKLSMRFGSADMERELDGSRSVRFPYWNPEHARKHSFGLYHPTHGYCGSESTVFKKEEAESYINNTEYLTIDEADHMLSQLGIRR